MRRKLLGLIVAASLAGSAMGATSASAATEFGNRCTATNLVENFSLISTANDPGDPLSATAPTSGIVTRWTFNAMPVPPGILSQTLKIFRPTGAPEQFQVMGESSPGPISTGLNTFATRIPVHAGDYLGTSGSANGKVITAYCQTGNEGDRVAVIAGNPTGGATATVLEEASKVQNPITATIEPDADNDGYGDETQDMCPQSAATQAPCPAVALSASAAARRGLVKVTITSSIQATVALAGSVRLGKGKVAALSGGTQIVAPGALAQFTVLFPKKLKKKLRSLSRKKSLKLSLTASAPNIVGAPTVSSLTVKVKGQKKTKRHRKGSRH